MKKFRYLYALLTGVLLTATSCATTTHVPPGQAKKTTKAHPHGGPPGQAKKPPKAHPHGGPPGQTKKPPGHPGKRH